MEKEIDEMEWLRAAAANPAFEFLKDKAEDIYKTTDGFILQNRQCIENKYKEVLQDAKNRGDFVKRK